MAAIYSNGGNRWNILGFNFNKRDALSSVYKISMIESHRSNVDDMPTISWRILHSNINNDDERKCIEAFEIKKRAGNIVNGCIGRTIITFKIYILHDTPE